MRSSVSTAFLNAAKAQSREVYIKAEFYLTDSVSAEHVDLFTEMVNLEYHQSMNDAELTIGQALSSYVIITCKVPDNRILNASYVSPYIGLNIGSSVEYCRLGNFYITNVESQDNFNTITVTAYDKLALLEEDYVPSASITSPTAQNVFNDICNRYGFPTRTLLSNYPITIAKGSVRQQIAWLVGLVGANAYISYDSTHVSTLGFAWYTDSGVTIGNDLQYLSGFVRTTVDDFTVNSLLTGTEDNPIACGSGTGIVHMNPYMTQARAEAIFADIDGFTYTPCNVKWRGNPAMFVSDIVNVKDRNGSNHNVCIMEQTIVVTGGMYGTIDCYGMTEEEIIMSTPPTEKRLKAEYKGLIGELQDATKTIIGANGGYYELLLDPTTGLPTGWSIRDTPTITSTTNMWIFNKNGLAHSSDGGHTVTDIALTAEGAVVADSITAGLLKVADTYGNTVFSANMDTGEVIINGSNGTVAFNNCPFTTSYSKTFLASNYTSSDFTRLQNIVTGSVTPTSSDYNKYDFNLDGVLDLYDFVRLRNMIMVSPPYGDLTVSFAVNMPANSADNLIRVYRVETYADGHTNTTEIFKISSKGAEFATPSWATPSVYSSRCAVNNGGYSKQGKKVEVSIKLTINSALPINENPYLILQGFPAPAFEAALSACKVGYGSNGLTCGIRPSSSGESGQLYISGTAAAADGDVISITGYYWTE